MRDTDKAWIQWGEVDPYYGVLSDEKFRGANFASHRDEFFNSGEVYIEHRLKVIENAFGKLPRGRALDFGCGVGRLTLPLARRFDEAVGIDISPAMLRLAEENKASANLPNAIFHLSDDILSNRNNLFDFVHTYLVLQHIPVHRGMAIIDKMLKRVAAGGGASIHVSLRRRQGLLVSWLYEARQVIPGLHAILNVAKGRPASQPGVQMNQYSLVDVINLFQDNGFPAVLTAFEISGDTLTAQICGRRVE